MKIGIRRTKAIQNGKAETFMKLAQVSSFKYLGVTLSKDGSSTTDIHIGMETTAAMAKLA